MCGGNRHRWRCVDKKCRKWYGWVRSHEEIPKDLGKKGRWKDLIKIRRKSPSVSETEGEQVSLICFIIFRVNQLEKLREKMQGSQVIELDHLGLCN
ncbi:unnamed protein product [Brugia pahangi]|uniref:GRF-type domain-containing protein n=1 Tax=Brugia pahangi TaxID=6280 RepID=A0A0N4TGG3_BRUPA|nr:unnamed protein product [Brugia pahangi]